MRTLPATYLDDLVGHDTVVALDDDLHARKVPVGLTRSQLEALLSVIRDGPAYPLRRPVLLAMRPHLQVAMDNLIDSD